MVRYVCLSVSCSLQLSYLFFVVFGRVFRVIVLHVHCALSSLQFCVHWMLLWRLFGWQHVGSTVCWHLSATNLLRYVQYLHHVGRGYVFIPFCLSACFLWMDFHDIWGIGRAIANIALAYHHAGKNCTDLSSSVICYHPSWMTAVT